MKDDQQQKPLEHIMAAMFFIGLFCGFALADPMGRLIRWLLDLILIGK